MQPLSDAAMLPAFAPVAGGSWVMGENGSERLKPKHVACRVKNKSDKKLVTGESYPVWLLVT